MFSFIPYALCVVHHLSTWNKPLVWLQNLLAEEEDDTVEFGAEDDATSSKTFKLVSYELLLLRTAQCF